MELLREGEVKFFADTGKLHSGMGVFYNPDKKFDRDVNIDLLRVLKPRNGVELLAASGVRSLRLIKEGGVRMVINDYNPKAFTVIKKNCELNNVETVVYNEDANILARRLGERFDYVDVDPFGTPVPFIESAVHALRNKGVLAVTATDSSALCGTYPKACVRKYGSKPLKNEYCHELGLRILIRKVIVKGGEQEVALTPVFSYSRRDYFRVYFRKARGASRVDELLEKIGFHKGAGPLWLGDLWDLKLLKRLPDKQFYKLLLSEAFVGTVGYYFLPKYYSMGLKQRKINKIIEIFKNNGFNCSRTHFDPQGVRVDVSEDRFVELLSNH